MQESTGYDSKCESPRLPATWEYLWEERGARSRKKNPNISRAPGDPEAIQKNKEEQVGFKTLISKCAVNLVWPWASHYPPLWALFLHLQPEETILLGMGEGSEQRRVLPAQHRAWVFLDSKKHPSPSPIPSSPAETPSRQLCQHWACPAISSFPSRVALLQATDLYHHPLKPHLRERCVFSQEAGELTSVKWITFAHWLPSSIKGCVPIRSGIILRRAPIYQTSPGAGTAEAQNTPAGHYLSVFRDRN